VRRAAKAASRTIVPDADGVVHSMQGYIAFFTGDAAECAAQAPAFEEYAVEFGVTVVRAEAAVIWLGAGRLDKVAEMIAPFTPDVLSGLPLDTDWLLTLQCVLEGAIRVGDIGVTTAVVALLSPYAGRSVVNGGAVMWHGVTDDTLARAHALLGDEARSARHRAAALATYERIGAHWWRDRLRKAMPTEPTGPTELTDARTVHLHEQAGGLWLLGREGATFVLPRMRGLGHLHALLSRPDTDLSAVSLVGDVVVEQSGIEVLDAESRRLLGRKLVELDAALARSERPEVREEREAVAAYLSSATGFGGRERSTGSNAERARVAVRKAVVAALAKIAESDPWLGRHLRDRVRTGYVCRYETDRDHPVRWILRSSA